MGDPRPAVAHRSRYARRTMGAECCIFGFYTLLAVNFFVSLGRRRSVSYFRVSSVFLLWPCFSCGPVSPVALFLLWPRFRVAAFPLWRISV
jgi:hypothetical protein